MSLLDVGNALMEKFKLYDDIQVGRKFRAEFVKILEKEYPNMSTKIAQLKASVEHHKLNSEKLRRRLYAFARLSSECIDALEQEQNDNIQLIDHLRDKKRLIKQKYENKA